MTFKPFNYAQAVGAGTQNALGQAQFMGAAKDFKRQNALEGAFRRAAETGEDPAAMLEAQGFGMEANALRQNAMQRAVSGLDWLAKAAPRVGPATYGKFKQQAEQFGIADPGELPDEYDPDLMQGLAGRSAKQLKLITQNLPEGMAQQWLLDKKTGTREPFGEPFARDAQLKIKAAADKPEKGEKPFTLAASDENAIFNQSGSLFGGMYDPASGRFSGLSKDSAQKAQSIAERAAQLFLESKGAGSRSAAVAQAARELGIDIRDLSKPQDAPPPPNDPVGIRQWLNLPNQ